MNVFNCFSLTCVLVLLVGCETTPAPVVGATGLAEQARIGTNYGGGIIFFIDKTGKHGLIAAPVDQGAGDWYSALRLCADYRGGGYSDWIMPSISQLHALYQRKDAVGPFSTNPSIYWSSTQGAGGAEYSGVWIHDFPPYGGAPSEHASPASGTNNFNHVRAIRAF